MSGWGVALLVIFGIETVGHIAMTGRLKRSAVHTPAEALMMVVYFILAWLAVTS